MRVPVKGSFAASRQCHGGSKGYCASTSNTLRLMWQRKINAAFLQLLAAKAYSLDKGSKLEFACRLLNCGTRHPVAQNP